MPKRIQEEFQKGHFVINKTGKRFSAIALDQAHEQNNKIVKGSGGVIGLTEDPAALQKWLVSGPEMARVIKSFEDAFLPDSDEDSLFHHSEGFSTQKQFQVKTLSLKNVFNRYGNPYKDQIPELVTLDSRNCLDSLVADTLRNLRQNGNHQYQEYRTKVLEQKTASIHDPIKRNKLYLPKTPIKKTKTKDGMKVEFHKNNAALFGKLCVAIQVRECDLMDLFKHEVQDRPPALTDDSGKMNPAKSKSDIVSCIAPNPSLLDPTNIQCKILDGPAIVHFIKPSGATTFEQYVDKNFIPYLLMLLQSCERLDIVFDIYLISSLKANTRENRGKGVRKKVGGGTKLPGNWADFLRHDDNKTELFHYIAEKISTHKFPTDKTVYVTHDANVLAVQGEAMSNCSHEESDTRMVVHLKHVLSNGLTVFEVRTVDSDVIVIFVANFFKLSSESDLQDMFILFGTGKSLQRFSVKTICNELGESKSKGLAALHALSGCDDISSVRGKGKKSFWNAWKAYPAITPVFEEIFDNPFQRIEINSSSFETFQRFMVVTYSPTCDIMTLNEARKDFFCHKNQSFENLPPTENAFWHHLQRVIFRVGVWSTADDPCPTNPSPADFGWKKIEDQWEPLWISIPEASRSCHQLLIKCTCKGNCSHCNCGDANLRCTQLCKCQCQKTTVD